MQGNWLDPEEQRELCGLLIHYNLLKFSNERNLPLKSGGMTDIYINLRDARNHPNAIEEITRYYANPLRRLDIDRFIEIPDSVSCFAGPLSMETRIPYLTIRESPKAGRVAKAKSVGTANWGESVCIIDDVITDGASKVAPLLECRAMGLDVQKLVVLVDRQQGWEHTDGIYTEVWAGMTLHDVRRCLIESGNMERCRPELEEKNPIIVALDGKTWEEVLPIADRLRTTGSILKVNDLLFEEGMSKLIPDLSVYGRVMADLKCHDIPNTVANTCNRLSRHNPWAVTIHATGGYEMMAAATNAIAAGSNTKVLAVTVLTSIDPKTCEAIYVRQPLDQVLKLAELAFKAQVDGFVCSPQELDALRLVYPGMMFVTPGIRSAGVDQGDQQRIDTPKGAMAKGATHLVMGRQILTAEDPIAEVHRVLKDELGISL